jgi:hypothetical protein
MSTKIEWSLMQKVFENTAGFEAISGRPIYCRDHGRRAEFASLTAREYEDEMALARWGLKQRSWNNQN